MFRRLALPLCAALLAAAPPPAAAADNEPAVQPEVARRDLRLPRIPSKDFEFGAFVGTYGTQNFGSSAVYGVRLGYHLTEDFFAEATLGRTRVSDDSFRQILPGGVFPDEKETLSYASLSAGWNVMPGEVFFGRGVAKASQFFVLGGIGSTHFNQQRRQTLHLGAGMKLLLGDRWALRLDLRDHLFSLDLLGKRQSTQNLEATLGLSWFY